MPGYSLWIWLALPAAGLLGWFAAALAQAYVWRVERGAAIDDATLLAALAAMTRGQERAALPRALGLLCALLMAPAGLAFALQPTPLAAAHLAACSVLLVLALVDARCGLLPDALTLPLLWAGLLTAWAGQGVSLHDAVLAAALGYGLLRGIDLLFRVWRGRAGLGGGDMKLVAALGAWLGWAPLPALLLAACVAGIAYAGAGRARQVWRDSLPFGPFLALAGASGLLGGPVVQFLF